MSIYYDNPTARELSSWLTVIANDLQGTGVEEI